MDEDDDEALVKSLAGQTVTFEVGDEVRISIKKSFIVFVCPLLHLLLLLK